MSPTEGTGRMPRPMRYRRYSARVQLVPSGIGAHTNKRKARPSGAAMAAARTDAAEAAPLRILCHKPRCRQLASSILQPLATQRVYVLTPARDAYLELELLDEACLEDGLEAGRLAPEFRQRGLELRDGHGVDLGLALARGTCRR